MTKQFLQATRIGCYAHQSLEAVHKGKVMGATSKGVFLLFGRYSLFLTQAQGLSPFNIVISENMALPQGLETGDEVLFSLGDLLIPARRVTVALAEAEVWTPAPLPPAKNGKTAQKAVLQALVGEIKSRVSEKGYLFLANQLETLTEEQKETRHLVQDFTTTFDRHDWPGCLGAAAALFGRGGGLTPSGDDFIAGFVLLRFLNGDPAVREIGTQLTAMAYEKTTFVSANRLEAACRGWSEGLFLRVAAKAMENENGELQALANALIEFGHSSGVDTLMGMLAACL